jgi:hypothetical protein
MRWHQGRSTVELMITKAEIERVTADRVHADHLLAQAERHLRSAEAIADLDPTGAFQLPYDAARKALCAVLENQGLRTTSRGGHIAVLEAVSAQLDPPLGAVLRPFDRLRRRRNQAEYPAGEVPAVTAGEIADNLPKVRGIVRLAAKVLPEMSPF